MSTNLKIKPARKILNDIDREVLDSGVERIDKGDEIIFRYPPYKHTEAIANILHTFCDISLDFCSCCGEIKFPTLVSDDGDEFSFNDVTKVYLSIPQDEDELKSAILATPRQTLIISEDGDIEYVGMDISGELVDL